MKKLAAVTGKGQTEWKKMSKNQPTMTIVSKKKKKKVRLAVDRWKTHTYRKKKCFSSSTKITSIQLRGEKNISRFCFPPKAKLLLRNRNLTDFSYLLRNPQFHSKVFSFFSPKRATTWFTELSSPSRAPNRNQSLGHCPLSLHWLLFFVSSIELWKIFSLQRDSPHHLSQFAYFSRCRPTKWWMFPSVASWERK